MRYEDTPGGGATFVLDPADRPVDAGEHAVSTVLLVEDDRPLRRAVRASLQSWDFDVLEAESGEEALTRASRRDRPDLVILDLSLPGIDGIETLRHLRSFTPVPVLVLTVRDRLGDKVTALDAGADDYMVKPFESEELIARAGRTCGARSRPCRKRRSCGRGSSRSTSRSSLVTWDGERVALTPTELRLLEVLLAAPRQARDPGAADRGGLGLPANAATRPALRIFVLHLRRKLHDDAAAAAAHLHRAGHRVPLDRGARGRSTTTTMPRTV